MLFGVLVTWANDDNLCYIHSYTQLQPLFFLVPTQIDLQWFSGFSIRSYYMLPANGVTKRSEQVGPKMLHHQTACHRFAGQSWDESVTKSICVGTNGKRVYS